MALLGRAWGRPLVSSSCPGTTHAPGTQPRFRLAERCGRLRADALSSSQPASVQQAGPIASSLASPSDPAAAPQLVPIVPKPAWFAQSGQPGCAAYAAALVGRPDPLGASRHKSGAVNFAVVSSSATQVWLVLFTEQDLQAGQSTHEIPLDVVYNHTGDVWHILLPSLSPDLLYGYRMSGAHQDLSPLSLGHRHDESVVLLDPYAKVILGRRQYGVLGPDLAWGTPGVLGLSKTWPQSACAVPPALGPSSPEAFNWEGDVPLRLPMEQLVIYEMHVRGFTQHESSGVKAPGTYAGLAERLDYLVALGINAVELLPVQEFNELEYYSQIPGSDPPEFRFNFWGYSTVGFFAPMSRYSASLAAGGPPQSLADEFKALVKECHKRGIEVILDVVFNHTAEGNDKGLTLSFRGLDNRMYYMLAPGGEYYNYSGCGNTFNCNHPVVRQFIIDCLRYWVTEYHVDGFRFDLASIMTRAHSAWHPDPAQPPPPSPEEVAAAAALAAALAAAAAITAAAAAAAAVAAAAALAAAMEDPESSPMMNSGNNSGDDFINEFEESELEDEGPPVGPIIDPLTGVMTDGTGTPTGTPLTDPALVRLISEDPVLKGTKLIAEAWDCDGLFQVGAFPHYGGRWSEWNGRFRDTVRNFIKGGDGWAGAFASAVCGSPDLYANSQPPESDWWSFNAGRKWRGGRAPTASINFVCAHDGFSLADMMAYNEKHNDANGEGNRDGESHNISWNCGAEGPTSDWKVKRLRQRQQRNMAMALLLSHGVPMIVMGDEYGHSTAGNNNTYCHDSPLNWLDWQAVTADVGGFTRFMRLLINFRRNRPELKRTKFVNHEDVQWHGEEPGAPDWSDTSRLVAYTMHGAGGTGLFVAFNTGHLPRALVLPSWPGCVWRPLVDTSQLAPFDFLQADAVLSEAQVAMARAAGLQWTADGCYAMLPWSAIILEAVPEAVGHTIKCPPDLVAWNALGSSSSLAPAKTGGGSGSSSGSRPSMPSGKK